MNRYLRILIITGIILGLILIISLVLFKVMSRHNFNKFQNDYAKRSKFKQNSTKNIEELYKFGIYDLFSAIDKKWQMDESYIQDYQSAIAKFNQIEQLDADSPLAYKGYAQVYYFKEEYDKSIENYLKVIELDKNDDEALVALGMIYLKTKEIEKARECLERIRMLGEKMPRVFKDKNYQMFIKAFGEL